MCHHGPGVIRGQLVATPCQPYSAPRSTLKFDKKEMAISTGINVDAKSTEKNVPLTS
jgi:hypothetical protein